MQEKRVNTKRRHGSRGTNAHLFYSICCLVLALSKNLKRDDVVKFMRNRTNVSTRAGLLVCSMVAVIDYCVSTMMLHRASIPKIVSKWHILVPPQRNSQCCHFAQPLMVAFTVLLQLSCPQQRKRRSLLFCLPKW